MKEVKLAQSCPTLYDPVDRTVHGILQARILEWVAVSFSKDLPSPGIKLQSPELQGDSLLAEPQGKFKVKEESEKAGLKLNIEKKKKKLRSWHLVPSLHGK